MHLAEQGCKMENASRGTFPVTLHYFPVRGRAEALRMLLRTAGKPYVDRLYTPEEWNVTSHLFGSGFTCDFAMIGNHNLQGRNMLNPDNGTASNFSGKVMKDKMPEGKGVPGVVTRPAGNRGLPVTWRDLFIQQFITYSIYLLIILVSLGKKRQYLQSTPLHVVMLSS